MNSIHSAPPGVVHRVVKAMQGAERVITVDGAEEVGLAAIEQRARTVQEVAEELRASLTQTVVPQRAGSSKMLIVIDPAELRLVVSGYRPLYERGAVRVRGEQAFRPGITWTALSSRPKRRAVVLRQQLAAEPGKPAALAARISAVRGAIIRGRQRMRSARHLRRSTS